MVSENCNVCCVRRSSNGFYVSIWSGETMLRFRETSTSFINDLNTSLGNNILEVTWWMVLEVQGDLHFLNIQFFSIFTTSSIYKIIRFVIQWHLNIFSKQRKNICWTFWKVCCLTCMSWVLKILLRTKDHNLKWHNNNVTDNENLQRTFWQLFSHSTWMFHALSRKNIK